VGKEPNLLYFGIIAVLAMVLFAGCIDETQTGDPTATGDGNIAQDSTLDDSPVATPTPSPLPDDLRIGFVGIDRVQNGNILPVTVELVGWRYVDEVHIEALLPMQALQVVDVDPDTDKFEVAPEIPDEKVLRNEVEGALTLYFGAQNLDLAENEGRVALCTIMLRATFVGDEDISLYSATIKSPEGEDLDVSLPDPFVITVQEDPVVTTPTATPSPKPTGTTQPTTTPTPGGEGTPSPTPSTTPTSSWTPAPLPPLSEVITEPIVVEPNSIYYRIQPRQTVYRLSKMFGTTVEAIVNANQIEDVSAVKAGAVLRIPVTPPAGKAAYFVSTKETLYSTAKAFGLTVEELVALNGIEAASYDDIEIGQWLVLMP